MRYMSPRGKASIIIAFMVSYESFLQISFT